MYNKVIVAIDLSKSSQKIIDTALNVVNQDSSRLVLVHVVEPLSPVLGLDGHSIDSVDLQQRILNRSGDMLEEMGSEVGISKVNQHILLGSPATEIRYLSKELNADAVVIGSHGHSGWRVLLGSTANKLLHGAVCDVLTVYVGDE